MCLVANVAQIPNAPLRVARTKRGIEGLVARCRVLAVLFERTIEEEPSAGTQALRGPAHQAHRRRPRRDVQDIGAEDRRELSQPCGIVCAQSPVRRSEVNPSGRLDVLHLCVAPPSLDAVQVAWLEIARPKDQFWRLAGEFDDMLTAAAADFEHIADLVAKKAGKHLPNWHVIAMEGRRVEPRVAFSRGLRWVLSRGSIH